MHEDILTKKQEELFPLIVGFSKQFGLVGGTAIALQIGHRRSVDFDLFSKKRFFNKSIQDKIRSKFDIEKTFVNKSNELTVLVNGVKITFYKYPFDIKYKNTFKDVIGMPDLLTLASMKSFALGRRAKWKDYVDLFFIFKKHSLSEVTAKAREIFGGEFNERLFREQLCYFGDIDYSEGIDYLPGFEIEDELIKKNLQEISLQK